MTKFDETLANNDIDTLVAIETSKLAKDKGFNYKAEYYLFPNDMRDGYNLLHKNHSFGPSFPKLESDYFNGYYTLVIPNPSQTLLQKWLRKIHNIEVYVHPYSISDNGHKTVGLTGFYEVIVDKLNTTWSGYETYEEALEMGLNEALKSIND